MKVKRIIEIDTEVFRIGDQIQVDKYTATCQKITKNGYIFCFDQLLNEEYQMNSIDTNRGGYNLSDLRKLLQSDDILKFFDSIAERMIPFKNGDYVRIPSVEEIFGNESQNFILNDKRKQWELMKVRKNRMVNVEDDSLPIVLCTWLKNETKFEKRFAIINTIGSLYYDDASYNNGVRLVFKLKR